MILDCSYRLPGPLATKLLADEGNEVVRIEYLNSPDRFSHGSINGTKIWYKRFNQGKKLKKLDCECFNDFLIKNKKDIVSAIVDEPSPFLAILKKNFIKTIVISSSRYKKRPIHDLDILARNNYFDLKTKIPELPFVGMLFAQRIVTEFYKLSLGRTTEKYVYLDEVSEILKLVTLKGEDRFYTGQVIGYNEYKLKDGALYLTALEGRSWIEFLDFIELPEGKNIHPTSKIEHPFFRTLCFKVKSMTKDSFSSYESTRQCFTII